MAMAMAADDERRICIRRYRIAIARVSGRTVIPVCPFGQNRPPTGARMSSGDGWRRAIQ